ncbi:MAG: hypothetical protein GXY76_10330 [Chloroflexi bacterium]|nr:hypothetical protein [Chloroflexota bacterium]
MNDWPKLDFHLHATRYRLSGGRPDATVANIAARCAELGYQAIGVVEHLDADPKHPAACLAELAAEFRTVSAPPRLYVGAELDVNVAGDGLSVPAAPRLKRELGLDYCLGSVHGLGEGALDRDAYIAEEHRRLLVLTRCPTVDVIAHAWSMGHALVRKGILPEWRFSLIPDACLQGLLDALRVSGQALEVNPKARADFPDPAYRVFIQQAIAAGIRIAIGSDAHSLERIGGADAQAAFVREVGLPAAQLWTPEAR